MASLRPIENAQGRPEEPMRIYQIFLDGIDKTGKDLIRTYIFYLGKGRYICNARGIMSMRVYADLYKRPYEYIDESQKDCLNVLLTVDKEDWEVRCKAANEDMTNYEVETTLFEKEFNKLVKKNYYTLKFDTSHMTPYMIAKQIVEYMEKINAYCD